MGGDTMSLNYTHIGLRIREIRTLKHISQAELAEEIDMSVSYISHVETAMKKASLETLVRISNAFGITIGQLLNGNQTGDTAEYATELSERMSDCSSYEKRFIFETVKFVKHCLRDNRWLLERDTREKY